MRQLRHLVALLEIGGIKDQFRSFDLAIRAGLRPQRSSPRYCSVAQSVAVPLTCTNEIDDASHDDRHDVVALGSQHTKRIRHTRRPARLQSRLSYDHRSKLSYDHKRPPARESDMTRLRIVFATALAAVAFSAVATADNPPAQPAPQAEAQPAEQPSAKSQAAEDPNDPVVCRVEPPAVGSRMRGRKVCKKRSEWGKGPDRVIHLPDNSIISVPGSGASAGGARQPLPGN